MIFDATIELPNGEQQTLEVIAPDEHEAHHMIQTILETLNEDTDKNNLAD
jgi:hypothetical protein